MICNIATQIACINVAALAIGTCLDLAGMQGSRVGKKISLEDEDGVLPYTKSWEKLKMGHWHKSEDGKDKDGALA